MTQPISGFTVSPAEEDDVYRAQLGEEWRLAARLRIDSALERSAAVLDRTDWSEYRKCSQVCGAALGEPCYSRNGKVVDGQPDGVKTLLDVPHKARKRRARRKVAFSSAPLAY